MCSLMWVKQMSQNVNCQKIIFNHDRQINEKNYTVNVKDVSVGLSIQQDVLMT